MSLSFYRPTPLVYQRKKENWSMHRTKLFYSVFGKEDNEENGSQVDERIFKVHINENEWEEGEEQRRSRVREWKEESKKRGKKRTTYLCCYFITTFVFNADLDF